MPKNVVVCCDGTANEFARDRTNVVKLYYTLTPDASQQIAYYHPGLGTMEPPGALTVGVRVVTRVAGLAVGYGLESDIRDAYVFLMNYFEPGDRLFLFGFSRGAYTARAVASLLHMYGLIPRGNEPLVPYAIRMLVAINKAEGKQADAQTKAVFDLAAEFKQTYSHRECKPWLVGVWDTVSSIGWIENSLKLPYTSDNPDIEHGRHAVAIDERRAFFRPNLWRPRGTPQSGLKDLKQVWFPGVHCDVGGGYPEGESGLSKIPLEWMLKEATALGLLVDEKRVDLMLGRAGGGYASPDPNAQMHESLTLVWRPAEIIPKPHYDWQTRTWGRRANFGRRRAIDAGSAIHEAAYLRGDGYETRLPANAVCVS